MEIFRVVIKSERRVAVQQIALEKLVKEKGQPLKTGKRSNRRREKGEKERGKRMGKTRVERGGPSVCLAEARTP